MLRQIRLVSCVNSYVERSMVHRWSLWMPLYAMRNQVQPCLWSSRTNEGQPANQTQYGNVDQSSWANTVAKVVWSVCTPSVHNDATVSEDGCARGKGCCLNDKCIQGDAETIVTCRSCRVPVTAIGATSTCQNKSHLEINGREASGGAV